MDALQTGFFNMIVINLFAHIISYPFASWRGTLYTTGPFPAFGELVLQFIWFRLFEEAGTYYGHRFVEFETASFPVNF